MADKIRCKNILNEISFTRFPQQPNIHSRYISCIQWYPVDTGLFSSSSFDGTVKLWDTNEFSVVASFDIGSKVFCSRMSLSGQIAIGGETNEIRICDPVSGGMSHALIGHRSSVTAIDWNPYSEYMLVSGGNDGTIKLWDTRKGGSSAIIMSLDWRESKDQPTFDKVHRAVSLPSLSTQSSSISGKPVSKIAAQRLDYSKQHIAKAMHRTRYDLQPPTWGGKREGAGRPHKTTE